MHKILWASGHEATNGPKKLGRNISFDFFTRRLGFVFFPEENHGFVPHLAGENRVDGRGKTVTFWESVVTCGAQW
jgi:hypothetical protein